MTDNSTNHTSESQPNKGVNRRQFLQISAGVAASTALPGVKTALPELGTSVQSLPAISPRVKDALAVLQTQLHRYERRYYADLFPHYNDILKKLCGYAQRPPELTPEEAALDFDRVFSKRIHGFCKDMQEVARAISIVKPEASTLISYVREDCGIIKLINERDESFAQCSYAHLRAMLVGKNPDEQLGILCHLNYMPNAPEQMKRRQGFDSQTPAKEFMDYFFRVFDYVEYKDESRDPELHAHDERDKLLNMRRFISYLPKLIYEQYEVTEVNAGRKLSPDDERLEYLAPCKIIADRLQQVQKTFSNDVGIPWYHANRLMDAEPRCPEYLPWLAHEERIEMEYSISLGQDPAAIPGIVLKCLNGIETEMIQDHGEAMNAGVPKERIQFMHRHLVNMLARKIPDVMSQYFPEYWRSGQKGNTREDQWKRDFKRKHPEVDFEPAYVDYEGHPHTQAILASEASQAGWEKRVTRSGVNARSKI